MALFLFSCGEENIEEIKNNEITISKKSSISAAHTVSPGGKVVYTVTVSNGGSSDMKIEISDTVHPEKELTALYEAKYKNFKKIYPALRAVFAELN